MNEINITRKYPIFIEEIKLKNYRTYENLDIKFDQNIHTLVGPNECGKTNLLYVFDLFNNTKLLQESDTCCYIDNIFKKFPEIEFKLNKLYFRHQGTQIFSDGLRIRFKEGSYDFLIPKNKGIKEMKYVVKLKGTLPTGKIHITLPELVEKLTLPEHHHIEQNKLYSFETNSKELVNKIKNYIDSHELKNNIVLEIKEEVANIPEAFDIRDILNRIKFINWSFKKEYYIPSSIPLSELQSNPQKYESINNFFKITKVDIKDFINTADHTRKENILRQTNDKISKILNQSWTQYQNLRLNLYLSADNALHIGFLENRRTIDPIKRSLGFQWFFAFLLHFNANFGNKLENCVILLDEPGIYLHPGGQRDLLKEIERLSLENQIIYTTHLPFMINRNHPERIIYLDKDGGITILIKPQKKEIIDDILLMSTLGFNFSSISNFGQINLFVEGLTDKILIEKLSTVYAEKFNEDLLDLNCVSIIKIGGVYNLESFIKVSNQMGINYLVLLDNDGDGQKKYKKYENNPNKDKMAFKYFYILPPNKEIEDMVPFTIFDKAYKTLKIEHDIWKHIINIDFEFREDKLINPQIDDLFTILKTSLENEDIERNTREISKHSFKLELMFLIADLIDLSTIESFEEIIPILLNINKKALNMLRERE